MRVKKITWVNKYTQTVKVVYTFIHPLVYLRILSIIQFGCFQPLADTQTKSLIAQYRLSSSPIF